MHPILFQLGPLNIYSYGVFVLLGFVAWITVTSYDARRRELPWQEIILFLLAGLVGAALGSRLVFILMLGPQPELLDFYTLFTPNVPHFHFLGILIGGYVGVVFAKQTLNLKRLIGDPFALGLAAMMSFVRIGCFLGGCCYGKPTDLPWAIYLHGAYRHPTQLYEWAFQVAALVVMWFLRDRMPRPGDLLKLYYFAYAVFRFFQQFFRDDNPVVALGLTVPHFLCLGILGWLAYVFATRRRQKTAEGSWW